MAIAVFCPGLQKAEELINIRKDYLIVSSLTPWFSQHVTRAPMHTRTKNSFGVSLCSLDLRAIER